VFFDVRREHVDDQLAGRAHGDGIAAALLAEQPELRLHRRAARR
jgi:hypothetical protein